MSKETPKARTVAELDKLASGPLSYIANQEIETRKREWVFVGGSYMPLKGTFDKRTLLERVERVIDYLTRKGATRLVLDGNYLEGYREESDEEFAEKVAEIEVKRQDRKIARQILKQRQKLQYARDAAYKQDKIFHAFTDMNDRQRDELLTRLQTYNPVK